MAVAKLGSITIVHRLNIENEHLQVAFASNGGVCLTQRTGSTVAGIGEELLPCFCLLRVGCLKVLFGHVALPAQLNLVDAIRELNAVRQATEGGNIRRHIFTDMTITASRSLNQMRIGLRGLRTLIDQRQAQSVNFTFHGEGRVGIFGFHQIHEAANLVIGEHIEQREHRHAVFDRDTDNALAANDLCRTVGSHEIWMASFDVTNLVHHGIVLFVRNCRGILLIVGGAPSFCLGAEVCVVLLFVISSLLAVSQVADVVANLVAALTLRLVIAHPLLVEQRIKSIEALVDIGAGVIRVVLQEAVDSALQSVVFGAIDSCCIFIFSAVFLIIGVSTRDDLVDSREVILEDIDNRGSKFHRFHKANSFLSSNVILTCFCDFYKVSVSDIISV